MLRRRWWIALVLAVVAALAVGTTVGVAAGEVRHRKPSVLFFGDSLAAGTGALPRRPVLAHTVASRMGWDLHVDAYGGTGYTVSGHGGAPYLTRLHRPGLLAKPYDVVLVEGGTNDARRHADPARLRTAVAEVLQYVRARQPHARIVLVGVYAVRGEPDPAYAADDRVIAEVAREQGVLFTSPVSGGWTRSAGPGFLSRDRFHPSTAGYRELGADVAAALAPHFPVRHGR